MTKKVKKFREDSLYDQNYPNYLSWNKTKWILKESDFILDKETNVVYKVKKVKLIPVPNMPPQIEVIKIEKKEDESI